jgi:hypothetical protein
MEIEVNAQVSSTVAHYFPHHLICFKNFPHLSIIFSLLIPTTTISYRVSAGAAMVGGGNENFQSRKCNFPDLFTLSPPFLFWINSSAVDLSAFSPATTRVKLLNQHKLRIHQGVKHIFTLATISREWESAVKQTTTKNISLREEQ